MHRPGRRRVEERLRRAKEDLHKGKAVSAAAAAARHGLRYPSWTDRVLFGALPHAGKDLEATSYSVAEELVGTVARSRGPSSSATSGCCTPSGASP